MLNPKYFLLLPLLWGYPNFAGNESLKLWPGVPPGEVKGVGPEEHRKPTNSKDVLLVANVSEPMLTLYSADPANLTERS